MHEVPRAKRAVVRRILAHRPDHDAIGQLEVAQRQRREQLGARARSDGALKASLPLSSGLPSKARGSPAPTRR
jgi:hypothetical protein